MSYVDMLTSGPFTHLPGQTGANMGVNLVNTMDFQCSTTAVNNDFLKRPNTSRTLHDLNQVNCASQSTGLGPYEEPECGDQA
jgi:hypothetical protein